MTRLAIYPGSFDPPTLGHLDVIRRAAALFDQVVVAVGTNTSKVALLPPERRVELLRAITAELPGVSVAQFAGLVAPWCAAMGADVIVKGVRSGADLDSEMAQATLNTHLGGPQTVLVPAGAATRHLSSTLVREIARLGGDLAGLVPDAVARAVQQMVGGSPGGAGGQVE